LRNVENLIYLYDITILSMYMYGAYLILFICLDQGCMCDVARGKKPVPPAPPARGAKSAGEIAHHNQTGAAGIFVVLVLGYED
jgi:hypothetical protein